MARRPATPRSRSWVSLWAGSQTPSANKDVVGPAAMWSGREASQRLGEEQS
ncbi:hypothetical protein HMPREF9056_00034 [Actinomyces sp. oral taxon 170 str. F0386]|nr:hypothetical protein HMPREF9056_00034 [Actinomyces sp. oral taxon 170 str. F0386]